RFADQVKIRFCAECNHSETDSEAVAAFCLDIAQNGFAFEAVETFAHRENHAVFGKVISQPCSGFRIQIAVQQVRITMHQTDLQFHHSQTRCRLACKQS